MSLSLSASTSSSHPVRWALGAWALVALVLSTSGVLGGIVLRVPAPVFIGSIVAAVLLASTCWPALRAWARAVDLRLPILYHLVRVGFGIAFLVLVEQGRLSAQFVPVGWGDVAAGLLAVPAAFAASRMTPLARRAVLAWNALGLLDMLMVMGTAVRTFVSPERGQLAIFGEFPFSTLPVLVVPLIILAHVLVFARLWRAPRA